MQYSRKLRLSNNVENNEEKIINEIYQSEFKNLQANQNNIQNNVKLTKDNVVYFYGDINHQSVLRFKTLLQQVNFIYDSYLLQLKNINKQQLQIQLHINSNGGGAIDSLHLYDVIKNNRYKVNTHLDGGIASGATIMFLAGNKRNIYQNSFALIHQIRGWVGYVKQSQVKQQYQNWQKIMNKVKNIYYTQLFADKQKINQLLQKQTILNNIQMHQLGFSK